MTGSALRISTGYAGARVATAGALGLLGGSFTIEAWVRLEATPTGDVAIVTGAYNGVRQTLHFLVRGGKPYLGFWAADVVGRTTIPVGVWTHLAARYDVGSKTQTVLINGIVDGEAGGRSPLTVDGDVYLAGGPTWKGGDSRFAEVRIWRSARTTTDIQRDLHRRIKTPGRAVASLLLPLDEGEGSSVRDPRSPVPASGAVSGGAAVVAAPGVRGSAASRALALRGGGRGVSGELVLPPEHTLEFFIQFGAQGPAGWARVLGRGAGSVSRKPAVWQGKDSRTLHWRYHPGDLGVTGVGPSDDQPFEPLRWYHVAGVRTANQLVVYVDGVERARAPVGAWSSSESLPVEFGGPEGWGAFGGHVAEVAIWDHARSPAALAASSSTALQGDEIGLLAYWPMVDPAAPLRDARRPQAVSVAGTEWTTCEGSPLAVVERESRALSLSATGSVVVPWRSALEPGSSLTVEAWVRPTRGGADQPVIAMHGSGTGWELRCSASSVAFLAHIDREEVLLAGPADLAPEAWRHVAASFDGASARLFVNGVVVADREVAGTVTPFVGPLTFGGAFTGSLAEVRLWDVARSPDEVAGGRFGRAESGTPGLVGCWRLNEAGGAVAADVAGQGGAGTVTGGTWVGSGPPIPPAAVGGASRDPGEAGSDVDADLRALKAVNAKLRERIVELEHRSTKPPTPVATVPKPEELEEVTGPLRLREFIARAQKNVEAARTALAQGDTAYRLGPVSLELNVVLTGAGGDELHFPTTTQLAGNLQTSKLKLDFLPKKQPEAAPPEVQIPDVTQYTEGVARQMLQAAGFGMDVAYRSIDASGPHRRDRDRVMTQSPPANVGAPPGSRVLVLIGREV